MFARKRRDDPEAVVPDVRLRFVLFRTAGTNFTIDAIVDDPLTGRLGVTGTAVTLRLSRPAPPTDDVEIEHLLSEWANDDRVVDVALGPDGSTAIAALRCGSSLMRMQLAN